MLEDKLEVKDKALQALLQNSITKLKATPYGQKLFENAITPTTSEQSDFNLSKIYIGYAGMGIGGNCYREIIDKTATRDVVYISDEEIKATIVKTLKQSQDEEIVSLLNSAQKQEITEPTSRFQEFLENYYQQTGTQPNQATLEHWADLKLFAQINKIKPLEQLIQKEPIKNMLSDSLTHLVAHEVSHGGQYNNGCQAITKQSFSMPALMKEGVLSSEEISRLSAPKKSPSKPMSFEDIKAERATENALEAGAMSAALVAFFLTSPSQEAQKTTLDYYQLRTRKDIGAIVNKYDIANMSEQTQDKQYTPQARNVQQAMAREIFAEVVKGMDEIQQTKLQESHPEEDCSYDYCSGEALISVQSSYRPELYGSKQDFEAMVDSIMISNKLRASQLRMSAKYHQQGNNSTTKQNNAIIQQYIRNKKQNA